MTKLQYFTARHLFASACALGALTMAPAGAAAASRHAAKPPPDVIGDFRALAQQRPWTCPPASGADASATWPDGEASCAWQNRLRRQTWRWSEVPKSPCISRQARWWSRAQAGLPPATVRSVWDGRWTVQTMRLSVGGEERLLMLRRDGADRWIATEWRWNPNPRPATRRWQEGRWKALMEAVSAPQYKSAYAGTPDALRLLPVFRHVVGTRAGEFGQDGLAFESAGLCLRASNPLPGQPKLSLSYSPNDSRLEQRAAMHLQLSRQYPNAKWLTPFKMLDMPAKLPSGAKFLATWVEGRQVVSQLWMPAKGDAPMVRVRMTSPLPPGRDDRSDEAAKIKAVAERELEAIAIHWAAAYE